MDQASSQDMHSKGGTEHYYTLMEVQSVTHTQTNMVYLNLLQGGSVSISNTLSCCLLLRGQRLNSSQSGCCSSFCSGCRVLLTDDLVQQSLDGGLPSGDVSSACCDESLHMRCTN